MTASARRPAEGKLCLGSEGACSIAACFCPGAHLGAHLGDADMPHAPSLDFLLQSEAPVKRCSKIHTPQLQLCEGVACCQSLAKPLTLRSL